MGDITIGSVGVGTGLVLVFGGAAVVAVAAWRSRSAGSALAYLREVGDQPEGAPADPRLELSLGRRLAGPVGQAVMRRLGALYPPANLDRLHGLILQAGLSGSLRAEELAAVQIVSGGGGVLAALLVTLAARPEPRLALLAFLFFPACGLLAPRAWIRRKVRVRSDSLARDLPDVLDLLTISVEAGLGLEQAMEATCGQMQNALSDELRFTLREMSLGLSRRDALENLRRRAPVEDLSSFVLVLTQADALGMPVGRVLKVQADGMRAKRRQRAREQAAKLPVKVLFPLVLFIFPPMMIIVLGPALRSIVTALHVA